MTSTPQPASQPATQPWLQRHIRLAAVAGAVTVVFLLLVVPPFISISRYKTHITELVSRSLGRPVRLSSVGLRLLPRPGFVLTDLTVEEDPAYGAEPVLHADTVVAYVHLWSLWRGHVYLDRISVDEASLNLVRGAEGRWNLDSLLRTAGPTAASGTASGKPPLPYMEATDSRINIKLGAEKLPYSLTNTDAALWQEDGAWRVRLRGQPVRTNVSLNAADTGVVRLEAAVRPAQSGPTQSGSTQLSQAPLRQMPLHLDLDWREAQLGQLSRLLLGSDEDWRGDLTGELHLDGTAEAAKITSRLRATGVHREEFQPASPLDFDATCAFLYHYSAHAAEKIECNSPIGSGRARLTGSLSNEAPNLTLELNRVPAQAPLDLLRTLRGNLDQSLSAVGSFSGKMSYGAAANAAVSGAGLDSHPVLIPAPALARHAGRGKKAARAAVVPGPLEGSFTAQDVRISGDGLSSPIAISKILLEPAPAETGRPPALLASFSMPAGGDSPLAVTARLARPGFSIALHGAAALARLRELAGVAAIPQAAVLGQISGDSASLDLRMDGPWLAQPSPQGASAGPDESAKRLTGTVVLRNAAWKPDFLAGPVEITAATLRFADGTAHFDPVAFAYGPAGSAVKGTASLELPACALDSHSDQTCGRPRFALRFAALNTATLQAALLGAKEPGTLLSTLLDRFRSAPAPNWPVLEGKVEADSLTAGVFVFTGASAGVSIEPAGGKITGFTARVLGGQVRGTGSLAAPAKQDARPAYNFDATFAGVSAKDAGQLVGEKWSGGPLSGSGTVALSGFTAAELAGSAKGTLQFDWRKGRMAQAGKFPLLGAFDRWNGTAKIEKATVTLGENQVRHGGRRASAAGAVTLSAEPAFHVTTPRR